MFSDLQKVISITTRNNINFMPLTCNYVESVLKGIEMTQVQIESIISATKFVLERRILNAYQGIGEITLDIIGDDKHIFIEVSDIGTPYWFDDDEIHSAMNKLSYKPNGCEIKKYGTNGQCFSMCFEIGEDANISAMKKQDDVVEILLDDNLTIRPVNPTEKEITEIVKCIYSNYGYSYINYNVYDLQRMKEILSDNKQWSYVGVNKHNQIMAHISLAFHSDFGGIPELGGLVSKPYCRGHNVANRMVKLVYDYARGQGLNGIFAQPVAFHPISQKMLNHNGFVPTGLIPNYVTPESTGPYRDGDRRQDVFLCAKVFDKQKLRTLCPPQEHKAFIKDIYDKLEVNYEFINQDEPKGDGDYHIGHDTEIRLAKLVVDNAPVNLSDKLSDIQSELKLNKIEVVEAYVNLSDSTAPFAYEELKKQGYIFGGVLPATDKGEYMLMVHTMGAEVCWDKMIAIDGYDAILEYIRNQ